jgi:hypothetical protein
MMTDFILALCAGFLIAACIIFALSPNLPACAYEDSSNCIWNAQAQGNGQGQSFIEWEGRIWRPE